MLYKETGQDRISTSALAQGPTVQGTDLYTTMWYNPTDINSTTAAMQIGSIWSDAATGNSFQYVKATAGLTTGQLVGPAAPTVGTVTAAGSTVNALITNITTTANEAGNYLWTLDAVGIFSAGVTPYKQALRVIKQSTVGATATFTLSQLGSIYGNNVYDPDQLPSVPANGSACIVIRPYNVILATATVNPVGVALGNVTSGNYTIIQIKGLAMVSTDATIAAVVNRPASVSGTAGTMSGLSSTYAISLTTAGASILPQYAASSGTVSLYPCMVNFGGM